MSKLGKIVVLIGSLGILALFLGGDGDDDRTTDLTKSMVKFCREDEDKVMQVLRAGHALRVLPAGHRRGERVDVDERLWAELPHDSKVSLALALYCDAMDADGRGTLYLFGWRDGDVKASVTDGNYFD